MSRHAKLLAVVFAISLAVATSIYAYAQSTSGAGNTVAAPQETTQVNAQDTSGNGAQVGADDEATGSQEAVESESEAETEAEESEAAEAANDPVEAPGTPGYEEGNFDGQHEFK
ncbi:MAG: hypothetical protein QME92_00490 [Bacillota bacterium]|nr:hypothetical protein [Bacillota bacterium]